MTGNDTLLRRISMGLAVIGLLIAGYLTWTHFTNTSVQCIGGSTGCEDVQNSPYLDRSLRLLPTPPEGSSCMA